MRKYLSSAAVLMLVFFAAHPLGAQESEATTEKPASLGLSMGLALPYGETNSIQDSEASFGLGFYVDLPLIDSFYIVPSAELYGLSDMSAADIDMGFKYILPISGFKVYAGVTTGVTSVADVVPFHVGLLAGGSMKLMKKLDAFAQVKYNVLFEGGRNMGVFHINAGIQFEF
jgi:hypothetical protein